jgi:hypothetical protein
MSSLLKRINELRLAGLENDSIKLKKDSKLVFRLLKQKTNVAL